MTDITTDTDGSIVINTILNPVGLETIETFLLENIESWLGKSLLWDVSKMDFCDISSEMIRGFTNRIIMNLPQGWSEKIAIVAPQDVQYGMMMVLKAFAETFSSQIRIHVFRAVPKAKDWLLKMPCPSLIP